jgi:hypothetical protein
MGTEPEGKSRKTDSNDNCEPALLDAGDLTVSAARPLLHVPIVPNPAVTTRAKLALILQQSAQDFHSFAESREFVSR